VTAERSETPWRPTPEQLAAAAGTRLRDVIGPGLRVLFVGINPSVYSAAVGHHFARPGNRFWPALHASGFTPRLFSPFEDVSLTDYGIGITNLVARATTAAAELAPDEYVRGAGTLRRKVARWSPRIVAFVGIGAYRTAFSCPRAAVGEQQEGLAGPRVWVLPNTSGLNANHQLPQITAAFAAVRRAAARP
jgi:double-stranded uracil-DNA glycosylase